MKKAWKKTAAFLTAALLLAGTVSCRTVPDSAEPDTARPPETGETASPDQKNRQPDTPYSTRELPGFAALSPQLTAVLEGDAAVHWTDTGTEQTLPERRIRSAWVAFADMDGDGSPEVLAETAAETTYVLREWKGTVYAYPMNFRSMYGVRTNGVFSWTDPAQSAYGIAVLSFDGAMCTVRELARIEEGETPFRFFVNGEEVTEEALQAWLETQEVPKAARYRWDTGFDFAPEPEGK